MVQGVMWDDKRARCALEESEKAFQRKWRINGQLRLSKRWPGKWGEDDGGIGFFAEEKETIFQWSRSGKEKWLAKELKYVQCG